jgi:hypothetical protein
MDRIAFEDYGMTLAEADQLRGSQPRYDFFRELGGNIAAEKAASAAAEAEAESIEKMRIKAIEELLPPDQRIQLANLKKELQQMPSNPEFSDEDKLTVVPKLQAEIEQIYENAPKPPTLDQQWQMQTRREDDGAIYSKSRNGEFRQIGKPTFTAKEWNQMLKQEIQDQQQRHADAEFASDAVEKTPFTPDYAAAGQAIMSRLREMPGFAGPRAPEAPVEPPAGIARPAPAPTGGLEGPADPGSPAERQRRAAELGEIRLNSLYERRGEDPAKWGDEREAGLNAAFNVVQAGGRLPPKVAAGLLKEIRENYVRPGGKGPSDRLRSIIALLLSMSQEGE